MCDERHLWDLQWVTLPCCLLQWSTLPNLAIHYKERCKHNILVILFGWRDIRYWLQWEQKFKHLLIIKGFIRTKFQLCNLCCMKQTFGYDSVDGAHCMYGSTKMSTVMNKWVLPRALCHVMSQGVKESMSVQAITYSHFLGPRWSASWYLSIE